MKLAFAITALTSMVTFVAADLQFSLSSRPSVAAQTSSPAEIPPFVGWSTDRCTITKALDKAEDDGWGEEGGGYWRFTFKDTYNREKFNVAYYPEKDNVTLAPPPSSRLRRVIPAMGSFTYGEVSRC